MGEYMSDKSLMDLKRGITMNNKVRIIKDTKNNSLKKNQRKKKI